MSEAEWLAVGSAWEVNFSALPGLSYRRFDYFLASALPLFFEGGLCAPCREVLKLLSEGADQSPPQSKSLWGIWRGYRPRSKCQGHGMLRYVLQCAEGNILMNECWNGIVQERFHALGLGEFPPREEGAAALSILRDIFGNPFQSISLAPADQTTTVLSLAQAAYEELIGPLCKLDPARLAVLSDALEEVGCTNEDILDHLRSPNPHVRGCWAVDLVLGLA